MSNGGLYLYRLLTLEEDRQKVLIDAGLREFAARGYDDASTNNIAKAAELSKPLMFHYIGTKKEFFLFLYEICMTRIKEHYWDLVDQTQGDLLERLRSTYLLKIQAMQDWPLEFGFTSALTLSPPNGDVAEDVRKHQRQYLMDANRIFKSGIDSSLFKPELNAKKSLELIAWAVGGYAEDLLHRQSQTKKTPDLDAIGTEFDLYLNELRRAFYR